MPGVAPGPMHLLRRNPGVGAIRLQVDAIGGVDLPCFPLGVLGGSRASPLTEAAWTCRRWLRFRWKASRADIGPLLATGRPTGVRQRSQLVAYFSGPVV